ncbi:Nuf2 family-domain-containing protein [Lactarius akahatsu]|uniref:Nuf2 family-domain-containing protein n=1 Tax=Lactarius akahatsu TaxID=416441 RepID=A0AAD4LCW1_9AGAM|nr:Nuf2 family-domain-containing protein [Lactarius akahatsu]
MNRSRRNPKDYWYPDMSNAVVVDSLNERGVAITHQQLVSPTPQSTLGVYSGCLRLLTGLAAESLREPVEDALIALDEPNLDIYDRAFNTNILVYHISRLAGAAKVPDFSSKDIFLPTSQRTRIILSAMINFIKFSEQCTPVVQKVRKKAEDLSQEGESMMRERARLETQTAQLQEKRKADEPRVKALDKENETLNTELLAQRDLQLTLLQEIETLKAERAALVQKKKALDTQTALASDGVSRVRSRVVQSPERKRRNISTMRDSVAEDKKVQMLLIERQRELRVKVSALKNITKDMRMCVEALQTMRKETDALEEAQRSLLDTQDCLDKQKDDLKLDRIKAENVKLRLHHAHERVERAKQTIEDKRASSLKAIQQLEKDYIVMGKERSEADKRTAELRAQADEVQRKMVDHLKRSKAALQKLLDEYWALRKRTNNYMENIAKRLGIDPSSFLERR